MIRIYSSRIMNIVVVVVMDVDRRHVGRLFSCLARWSLVASFLGIKSDVFFVIAWTPSTVNLRNYSWVVWNIALNLQRLLFVHEICFILLLVFAQHYFWFLNMLGFLTCNRYVHVWLVNFMLLLVLQLVMRHRDWRDVSLINWWFDWLVVIQVYVGGLNFANFDFQSLSFVWTNRFILRAYFSRIHSFE